MEQLVSVIVPVYNTEEYLDECIESIVFQTYKNLQIILIDDGSTDLSGKICDKWKELDKRIMVIHQKNIGVSGVRNVGLRESTGQWIAFVDSDDSVKNNYIEKLLDLSKRWKTDISCCLSNVSVELYAEGREKYMGSKVFLMSKYCRTTVWSYIYKKNLFENILFPEGKLSEDVAVLYKIIYRAKQIAVTLDVLYNYRVRAESLSHSEQGNIRCDIDRIDILKEKALFFESYGEKELAETAWREYLTNVLVVYGNRRYANLDINRCELKKEYRVYLAKVHKSGIITWKLRCILYFAYIFPGIGGILLYSIQSGRERSGRISNDKKS